MNSQKDRLMKLISEIVGPEDAAKIIDAMEHSGFMFARRTFLQECDVDEQMNGKALG